MTKKFQILAKEILQLSSHDTWEEAKQEWELDRLLISEEPATCLCSHHPIRELCVLSNTTTNQSATVGNCCVNHFMELPSELIFQAIKRTSKDPTKSLNKPTLAYAKKLGWLDSWALRFYSDIMLKRNLSGNQLAKKQEINTRVNHSFSNQSLKLRRNTMIDTLPTISFPVPRKIVGGKAPWLGLIMGIHTQYPYTMDFLRKDTLDGVYTFTLPKPTGLYRFGDGDFRMAFAVHDGKFLKLKSSAIDECLTTRKLPSLSHPWQPLSEFANVVKANHSPRIRSSFSESGEDISW